MQRVQTGHPDANLWHSVDRAISLTMGQLESLLLLAIASFFVLIITGIFGKLLWVFIGPFSDESVSLLDAVSHVGWQPIATNGGS